MYQSAAGVLEHCSAPRLEDSPAPTIVSGVHDGVSLRVGLANLKQVDNWSFCTIAAMIAA